MLVPEKPARTGVGLDIIDPTEPAIVQGRVINSSGIDTALVSVGLFAGPDSLPAAYYTYCDTLGRFELRQVLMGTYAVAAFIDLKADSMCGLYPCGPDSSGFCQEPCVAYPDSITLAPGDEVTLPPIRWRVPG